MPQHPSASNENSTLRAMLLLADPSLRDGVFDKSVILLNEHLPDRGAMGLILNHPTGKSVGDFLSDPLFAPLRHLAVHDGGPVERDQMTFSSFWWSPKLGLRWAIRISADDAAKHAKRPGRIVSAFIGHSAWSAGQLEAELRQPAWFLTRPDPDLLGRSHDLSLWAHLMKRISPFHQILAEAPKNPHLN